jgi:Uma2 family endonuclease
MSILPLDRDEFEFNVAHESADCYNPLMILRSELPTLTGHTVFHGVSWEDYERVLEKIGDGHTRVTFLDESMEIMSPLHKHESPAEAIGVLLGDLSFEFDLPLRGFGSPTYRYQERKAGLEPDRCYYIQNEEKVRGMERFDPKVYPAPDLAIEVDLTRRSIPREPIYARLGVPEIWRFRKGQITVRLLSDDGTYQDSPTSLAFPFLPMDEFVKFVQRMIIEDPNRVKRDFRKLARTLRAK